MFVQESYVQGHHIQLHRLYTEQLEYHSYILYDWLKDTNFRLGY